MRKVIVQQLTTVDGFAAGPDGELDFFEAVEDYSEVDADNLRILDDVDTVVLGARTYRMFVGYWPSAEGEPVAQLVNSLPKLVFSSTLEDAPWGRWEPARVVRRDVADEIAELKGGAGADIMVWGSLSVSQALIRSGLVDEIQLRVCPIALGAGRQLFPDGTEPLGLRLVEAKSYGSGIVSLRYQPEH